jgi:hypothetical protein
LNRIDREALERAQAFKDKLAELSITDMWALLDYDFSEDTNDKEF